jgi:Tfp pilus assembly protein PilO
LIDSTHGVPLLRRAVAEHRRLVVAIGVALAANLLVYAFVVYPLADRVANIEQRNQAAALALAQAQTEHMQATGTLTGKARAAAELTTFYRDVLPQDLAGARRLTYLRLARLARESNLEYERSQYAPQSDDDSTLTRLQIQMVLSGTYAEMRDFIYQLETAPEFVVIDNIQLAEGSEGTGSLVVTLDLSTYFRVVSS